MDEHVDTEHSISIEQVKTWVNGDLEHKEKWVKEAEECYKFYAGDQWSAEDKQKLIENLRPMITFNRTQPVINSVAGMEISNRQEAQMVPREAGDQIGADGMTEANRWFRDTTDANDADSEAFMDDIITGMGWTETSMDFTTNMDGDPTCNAVNPLEMFWDRNARKRNLLDAERLGRVRKISTSTAKRMFPGHDAGDLDAKWADTTSPNDDNDSNEIAYDDEGTFDGDDASTVTVVQLQWAEYRDMFRVIDPMTGKEDVVGESKRNRMAEMYAQQGQQMPEQKVVKRVVMNAFIGKVILESGEALCPDEFSFRCVTGFMDKITGLFYGLMRQMMDPQRWANKWMSQALDILNSQAKGGMMAEAGAIEDKRAFDKTWARTDKITMVANGTLSNPNGARIQPKPQPVVPSSFFQMMEFAISSVRDVTGVNVEMLGLRDANQPASLEHQRKQAGMQILQPLFDSLKVYRRYQAKNMLYIIQNYLSDGRLIRILGPDGQKYIPLMKKADIEYDIIIDDMPSSPNMKEAIWRDLTPVLPNVPPQAALELFLEYGTLPESAKAKFREIMAKINQPDPMEEQMKQATVAKEMSAVEKNKSEAAENEGNAMRNVALAKEMMGSTQSDQQRALADLAKVQAATQKTRAETDHTQADTRRINIETRTGARSSEVLDFVKLREHQQ